MKKRNGWLDKLKTPIFVYIPICFALVACGGGGGGDPRTEEVEAILENVTVGDTTIAEGDIGTSNLTFTFNFSTPLVDDIEVSYATSDGSATAGIDYTATSGSLTITAGSSSGSIDVPIIGDTTVEGDETFNLMLSSPGNTALGTATLTGTIVNDDIDALIPVATISNASRAEGSSGSSNLSFAVSLDSPAVSTVAINYATSDGTASAGSDYIATSGSLTIMAGSSSGNINVPVIGDTSVEGDETFTLTLSSPTNATLGASSVATGTIVNDDFVVPVATISIASRTEGNTGSSNLSFTVSLDSPAVSTVSINYATSDGTASAGSDYTATSGTLTITAGSSSGNISVPVIGDTSVEEDETFTLTLSSPTNATLGTPASVDGTIVDDDADPTIIATIDNASISEGGSGSSNLSFTVSLNSPAVSPVSIAYATSDGTASAGSDYTATSGSLEIAVGNSSGSINVPIIGDTSVEGDETFTLTLSSPTNATLGAPSAATGTIVNDDIVVPVATIGNASVTEGNIGSSNLSFTVSLDSPAVSTVAINYATSDGTASAGSDYTDTSGSLEIAVGNSSGSINVPIIGDTSVEGDETFTLTLSSPTNATLGAPSAATGTIVNDDIVVPVATIGNASVTEGNIGSSNLSFTVSLDSPAVSTVAINYATSDGTASAGSDYTATSGSLQIAVGNSSGSINVPIIGDTSVEGDETFTLTLSSPTNATLGTPALATGTVVNDDSVPSGNANLSNLQLSAGTLDQIFQSSQLGYTSAVDWLTAGINIKAITEDVGATLTINGVATPSGQFSTPIDLEEGANAAVPVVVTSSNGLSQQTYNVSITRASLATFAQRAFVKASNTGSADRFGSDAAIFEDTLVVGAPDEDGNDTSSQTGSGAVYVFLRQGGVWSQQAYIKTSTIGAGDNFGSSVAIFGDTIAVGAPQEDSNGTSESNNDSRNSGAVYVFTRQSGVWNQQAYLKASNIDSGDNFGASLALSENTLAVGAPEEDSDGSTESNDGAVGAGAAYIFSRVENLWSQQAYVKASNTGSNDKFGGSLTLSGDTLAVGARGESSNGIGVNSVAQSDNSALLAGAVYVFTRAGSVWSQQAYVKASNTDGGDEFGTSVALSDDTLAVGAPKEASDGTSQNNGSAANSGAAYVFTRSADVWSQQAYLKASNVDAGDGFGAKMSLFANTLAISSLGEQSTATGINNPNDGNVNPQGLFTGAVYTFTRASNVWSQHAYIKASNTGLGDRFGEAAALSGDTLAVGASSEGSDSFGVDGAQNNSATGAGAVYVFR